MSKHSVTPNDGRLSQRPVVLQVLHTLQVGGAEVLAARLAQRLRDRYEFVFACLDGLGTLGEQLQQDGFRVEVLGRKPGIDVQCVRKLAHVAQQSRAQLIHAHQYTPFFYARAPGWAGRRLPVLFTEHGRVHPDLPNRKRMIFNRLFLRKRDHVVAVGEAVKRALVTNEGIAPARIEVIHNGVRLADFKRDAATRAEIRAQLGIANDAQVAIQVARLDYLKDHSTALRMAERVRRNLPHFQLLLVGEGPERTKIEQEIAQRQLGGTVRLLGLRTDIATLLAAADLFLLTSISEGIPVTLIEAMGAGLPVVSTDVGGVAEVVINSETGYLTPAGDDAQLATRVFELFATAQVAERFGMAGRQRAERSFTESSMHEAYANAYEKMLSPKATRRTGAIA